MKLKDKFILYVDTIKEQAVIYTMRSLVNEKCLFPTKAIHLQRSITCPIKQNFKSFEPQQLCKKIQMEIEKNKTKKGKRNIMFK